MLNKTTAVSKIAPLPAITGRLVAALPSERHVRALQKLLGSKISQEPAIGLAEFQHAPESFPDRDRLIFLEAQTPGEAIVALPAKTSFLAEDVFVMADGKLINLRDMSSRRWGENGGLNDEVFARFDEVLSQTE